MRETQKFPDLLGRIQQFEVFKEIEDRALEWLIDKSTFNFYEAGDHLFWPDKATETMQIMVDGEFIVRFPQGNELRELGTYTTGYVTGILPFSRMQKSAAYGTALRDTYVLELNKSYFTEMTQVSYELTQSLVSVMSNRIRHFTQTRLKDEKLMSLGKLSAGLAHELNNPASSIVRNVEELYSRTHQTPERFKAVITMRITPEQTDRVNAILFSKIENRDDKDLSLLERESMKDDLLDWLEDHEVGNAEEIADTFIEFGLTEDDLDEINDIIEGEGLHPILWWIESTLSLEGLVSEIREASVRIAELIRSIKSFTHMDRAQDSEPIDLHEGLINTKMILKHQLKKKNIQVVKNFAESLPKVVAWPGELNQVWTNLMDNAIDALEHSGTLTITTYAKRDRVFVEIMDNGSGIPEDVQSKIFDPFFTTKGVNEGTGLGLDVVHRIVEHHRGKIEVESEPGRTVFRVYLPAV